MRRNLQTSIVAVIYLFLASATGQAAEQNAGVENKLRETLRATMLQLRDVQTQLATLQGTQTELEEKNKSLDDKLKVTIQKADKDKLESDKTVDGLKIAINAKDAEITQLRDVLEKAKLAIEQKDRLQVLTEEKRKQFEEKAILLDRRVADQQRKNAAMYQLGLEVIGRYEKFGLGDAISAREPFIGATRVKFENLVQDYQDKLTEQKIKPNASGPQGATQTDSPAKGGKVKTQASPKRNANGTENGARPHD
jgi:hypothetical protein